MLITSLITGLSYALYVKAVNSRGSHGEINLRSYFHCGTGTVGDPYVITRSRHLYNLSRLQGLGVFGNPEKKKYFQLGYQLIKGDENYYCYTDNGDIVPYLDMNNSNLKNDPINAIGSESTPFYGVFDGKNVEIKNLNVYADPEDSGLFGYTASGSNIHNLFLSNINIHAMGYDSAYSGLYSDTIKENVGFKYYADSTSDTFTTIRHNSAEIQSTTIDLTGVNSVLPKVSVTFNNSNYEYKLISSSNMLSLDEGKQSFTPDVAKIKTFFDDYKENHVLGDDYPVQTTINVSLVASVRDNYGLEHSSVALTLSVVFTLDSNIDNEITMELSIGEQHGGNIGLIVGHCDGSVIDCYVNNGRFYMNDQGKAGMIANNSSLGLVGLIGTSVHNVIGDEESASTEEGTTIGTLDFTKLYNNIINSSETFPAYGSTAYYTYTPKEGNEYMDYLRYDTSNPRQYVTAYQNAISLRGREVVQNPKDLGVFTIVSHYATTGVEASVTNDIDKAVIQHEDIGVGTNDDEYYVYYSTGEYQRGKSSGNPLDALVPGYTIPTNGDFSYDSLAVRELNDNIIFRVKVGDHGQGFYFSERDKSAPGGEFISSYLNYKLVDRNGNHIPDTDGRSGLMLRTSRILSDGRRKDEEISSFSSSFALVTSTNNKGDAKNTMYCFEKDDVKYAANMINFEISSDLANVTVVAASADGNKAGVGVYQLDTEYKKSKEGYWYHQRNGVNNFTKPDYAFLIPSEDQLAYYDYHVIDDNGTKRGYLGKYDSDGNFQKLETIDSSSPEHVAAVVKNEEKYGYEADKPRLFAHTFLLPSGRYCLGSCTGTAKIYYACAQGQVEGELDYTNQAYSKDEVKNIDFIKKERFTDSTVNISDLTTDHDYTYSSSSNKLFDQRCYVALAASNRSAFKALQGVLEFVYNSVDGKFYINAVENNVDKSWIKQLAVNNYGRVHGESYDIAGLENMPIVLLGAESSDVNELMYIG